VNPRILALCGSTRAGSFNRLLLEVAASGARAAGGSVTTVALANFPLPLYDADFEAEHGLPHQAEVLQSLVASHHALLIATPEYNGGYTAVLKNALDWISRPKADGSMGLAAFAGKLAALVSASPGPLGGIRSQIGLKIVLDKLGVIVIPHSFALAAAHQAFDGDGALIDHKAAGLVSLVGSSLVHAVGA
jgi:NAD(P)H-dependent FMN reductase